MKWLAVALLASAFVACSTMVPPPPEDRYLTKEQDADMRAQCADTGCAIVPLPQ